MKKCPNCGRAYSDMVKVCSACGTNLAGGTAPVHAQNTQNHSVIEKQNETKVIETTVVHTPVQTNTSVDDSGSILWGIPGFFFPIAGWILYFVWKNTKPKTAKVASVGAWIGFALGMIVNLAAM